MKSKDFPWTGQKIEFTGQNTTPKFEEEGELRVTAEIHD